MTLARAIYLPMLPFRVRRVAALASGPHGPSPRGAGAKLPYE